MLAAVAIYDLVAVLCPRGPLRVLVETAQERDESLFPALIYSSTMMWGVGVGMADTDTGVRDVEQFGRESRHRRSSATDAGGVATSPTEARDSLVEGERQAHPEGEGGQGDAEEEEMRGVKLGLGDFIFYSVLVGKAATVNDWTTIISCYVGILIGLACTLLLLSIYQKALPALPISVAFGLIFYFCTSVSISPFIETLATFQVQI